MTDPYQSRQLDLIVAPCSAVKATAGIPAPVDPTTIEREMRIGSNSEGQCVQCHRYFSSLSAFDKHHTLAKTGDVICHDPGTRGLVMVERRGFLWWGWPQAPSGIWKRDE